MSKKSITDISGFGDRMVVLRKTAGFTQLELAKKLGISRRMIAYYEGETEHPPTTILPRLAQALNVSTDEILNGDGRRAAPSKMVYPMDHSAKGRSFVREVYHEDDVQILEQTELPARIRQGPSDSRA
jgi:transcriptional regulator with XRE-family HTH domain